MEPDVDQVVTDIFALYEKYGHADYIGEPVSQLEHMSQSAQLAMSHGCDDDVVLAAFFHDIGHLCGDREEENSMGGYGIKRHEKIGADFLRVKGFPERVARLVENHVQAKRYLTWRDPEYYNGLSEASKKTLSFQGGIMSNEEAHAFQKDPLFEASILLRRWDELAKEINIPLVDMEKMKAVAKRVLVSVK